MKSHPNLASRSDRKWCRFTNAPDIFGALPQIWGAKTSNSGPLPTRHPQSTPHVSGTKRRVDTNLQYVLKKLIYFP